eukprot:353149-Chlamydomonas_euryale.AAC.14
MFQQPCLAAWFQQALPGGMAPGADWAVAAPRLLPVLRALTSQVVLRFIQTYPNLGQLPVAHGQLQGCCQPSHYG